MIRIPLAFNNVYQCLEDIHGLYPIYVKPIIIEIRTLSSYTCYVVIINLLIHMSDIPSLSINKCNTIY